MEKTFTYENKEFGVEHGLLYERVTIGTTRAWSYRPLDPLRDAFVLAYAAERNGWTGNIADRIERFHNHEARHNTRYN